MVERGEGDRRPSPDGWSVVERGQHDGEPTTVPDRSEGGDRRLATEGVVVPGGHLCQGVDGGRGALLAERPGRHLCHERVGVVEGSSEVDRRTGSGQLARPAPYHRVWVAAGASERGVVEGPQSFQCSQCAGADHRGLLAESRPGRWFVAEVAGEHHGQPTRSKLGVTEPWSNRVGGAGDPARRSFRARLADRRSVLGAGRAGGT